ncbi:MAG: NAD-dependent epimerase/dehydratase family protein, partial [Acidobacteria bacterium]|nr:NAD-dependent epimerase/dehydratase family protein [Acidobacteriota bacterium]
MNIRDPSNEKVLITGASGFLGQYIFAVWERAGAEVFSISRGADKTLPTLIQCDLSSSVPNLDEGGFATVIHCAGKAHSVPRAAEEENEFFRVNVDGTRNLLKAIDATGTLPERFIFISSASVYGVDEGIDIDERSRLNATVAY